MPKALAAMKPLPSRLAFYMGCFNDLLHDRQIFIGGASPISFEAMDRWARRHGVVGDQFERLAKMVRALDAAWLKDYDAKLKEQSRKR